jgi:serine/threonine protein kinase
VGARSGEAFLRPKPGMLVAEKYRVERVIGEGGMGVVVEAIHVQLGQRVAIKFLLPGAMKDEQAAARFAREARAAAKIKSEYVARVQDVGEIDGVPFIVMEHLEGRELRKILQDQGKLPVETTAEYALQACEALAEVHAAGIVHRDLKPANLFVTERADGSPVVKLLDFGISKITEDEPAFDATLTTATTVMGSPGYMAPEQLKSTKDADARADVWALGTVLYEALTGRPAFSGDSMAQVCAMVASEDPPLPSSMRADLPMGFERAVLRCLEKQPERRFQDVGELAAAIAPFAPERARDGLERIEATLGTRSRPRGRPSLESVASAPTQLAIPPSRTPSLPEVRARSLSRASADASLPIVDPRTMSSVERDAPPRHGTRWGLLFLLALVAGGAAFAVYSGRVNVHQVETSVTRAAAQVASAAASVAASAAASVSASLPELTAPPSASVTLDPPAPDDSADDEPVPSASVAAVGSAPPQSKPRTPPKRPTRHGGRRHRWH